MKIRYNTALVMPNALKENEKVIKQLKTEVKRGKKVPHDLGAKVASGSELLDSTRDEGPVHDEVESGGEVEHHRQLNQQENTHIRLVYANCAREKKREVY